MTDLRTSAQQALDALEAIKWNGSPSFVRTAIMGLKAALAEPVQEPAAWMDDSGHPKHIRHLQSVTERRLYGPLRPLYTAPPQRPAEPVQEPQCNPHPKAPHGFLRNASHTEDRYVCECEGWEPYEAGYQAGMEAALRDQS